MKLTVHETLNLVNYKCLICNKKLKEYKYMDALSFRCEESDHEFCISYKNYGTSLVDTIIIDFKLNDFIMVCSDIVLEDSTWNINIDSMKDIVRNIDVYQFLSDKTILLNSINTFKLLI